MHHKFTKIKGMSKFGKNIKKIRNVRGLTQTQLADLLEVSRGVISSYEEGRAEPKIETILKTAEVFHLSTDILLSSNVTVNQLSGFSLPTIIQNPVNQLSSGIFSRENSGIFPNNLIFILSDQVEANAYIKPDEIIFAVPHEPVVGKLFVVQSNGVYKIGKVDDYKPNSIILDNSTFSLKESKGLYEVLGIYSPVKDKTPLEKRLASMEHKIKLLEEQLKSQ
ncbi:DNA-binding XRE family transcriptional regulator [Mongoliibacter ruber]|uniref:DNA-binding XRE family transcriptional regulator n=2 Tax=Mongoliibacter ruber TaxID=1750599 RepID=A0A2T0WVB1_9BACT|nr:DNA-binding XRE family transcriptional regulator [Mongoliibacter ruber]